MNHKCFHGFNVYVLPKVWWSYCTVAYCSTQIVNFTRLFHILKYIFILLFIKYIFSFRLGIENRARNGFATPSTGWRKELEHFRKYFNLYFHFWKNIETKKNRKQGTCFLKIFENEKKWHTTNICNSLEEEELTLPIAAVNKLIKEAVPKYRVRWGYSWQFCRFFFRGRGVQM